MAKMPTSIQMSSLFLSIDQPLAVPSWPTDKYQVIVMEKLGELPHSKQSLFPTPGSAILLSEVLVLTCPSRTSGKKDKSLW